VADEFASRVDRVAKRYPSGEREYLNPKQQGRKQRPGLTDEQRRSWDACIMLGLGRRSEEDWAAVPKSRSLIVHFGLSSIEPSQGADEVDACEGVAGGLFGAGGDGANGLAAADCAMLDDAVAIRGG
jgi:hypothetical protein